jgi:hypothetical protein
MEEVEETSGETDRSTTRLVSCDAGGDFDDFIVARLLLHCNNETTGRMESHR